MLNQTMDCCLVGETSLTIKYAEILIEKGCHILGVISKDELVQTWAEQHDILAHPTVEEAKDHLQKIEFDYVFNIANSLKFPTWLLDKPRKLAIEYQNGPVSDYTDELATSWTILNNKKQHKIVWHIMAEGLNVGDILKQSELVVDDCDTAFSLNIKCYERSIKDFIELVNELILGEENRIRPLKSQRTSLLSFQIPVGGGILDWSSSANEIERLCRALDFGIYPNYLVAPKFVISPGVFYIPLKCKSLPSSSKYKPGEIICLSVTCIQVTTREGIIQIDGFLDMQGIEYSPIAIKQRHHLIESQSLPIFSKEYLKELSVKLKKCSLYESFWVNQWQQANPCQLPWGSTLSIDASATIKKVPLFLSKDLRKGLQKYRITRYAFITRLLVYLSKLLQKSHFTLYFQDESLLTSHGIFREFFADFIPLNVKITPQDGFYHIYQQMEQQLLEIKKHGSYSADLIYRFHQTINCASQLSIALISTSDPQNVCLPSSVLLGFIIDSSNQNIYIASKLPHEYLEYINRIPLQVQSLFAQILENRELAIQQTSLMTPEEIIQVTRWNETRQEYPSEKSIHHLFEEAVSKTPDAIAIVFEAKHITYSALNRRANQLAHYLRQQGVKLESRIGVALPRGIELIVGIMAALKSGAAYVPLAIDYPQERLGYMLEDSKVKVLLSQKALVLPSSYCGTVVYLDETAPYDNQPENNLDIVLYSENLAYITYTSGSTGRPKGVACDHRGVINRLYWGWKNYSFKKDETCCLQSNIAFVDSTWDIFGTLLVGARLVLFEEAISKNIEELLKVCFFHKISRITLIPSFLKTLIDFSGDNLNTYTRYLSHWEITGESFKPNLIDHFFKHMGQTSKLLDCYGATEATSVIYRDYYGKSGLQYQTKILSNTQIYLLDAHLNLVPLGLEGEIYIGGVGLARGYLNKPGLTAERFIPSPFELGGRLYKTGDLGRYLPDGNIEFLGRIDYQLKLRGFRIDLAEIEGTIEVSPAVQQAIVLCREDVPGQKRLVAYVVPKTIGSNGFVESLRSLCQTRLPDYMQPSQWVVLGTLPLTPNGKIDRKSLPAPEGREGLGLYQTPKGVIEEQIAQIWSELFGIEIGREDDFFRLGGHSLLATQMASRLRKVLRIEVSLKAIFEHSVLSELASYLEQSHLQKGMLPAITRVSRDKAHALSFAQQRLWFLEQLLPNTGLYHNPMSFRLLGDLNVRALHQALDAMVARHEILRTVIINVEGIALQKVLSEDIGFSLSETMIDIQTFIKEPFQFESKPLCRGLLLKRSEQEHVLLLVFHHIVVDGWSMGIFCKELNALYLAYSENKIITLAPLSVQYIDYSVWQRSWLQGELLEKQLSYWKEQLREVSRLELPMDFPRPKELSYQGGVVHRKISKELLEQLQAFSQSHGVTLFMSLVGSIQGFLSRYCNQKDIIIGTPIANRRAIDIEGLIGFFVNTLVLRSQLDNNPSFETLIKQVESTTLLAYEHQDVPFEQLVEYLQVSRELNRNPLFQVMFTLQYERENIQLGELEILSEEIQERLSRFDLSINAFALLDGLYLEFEYASELFSHQRIEKLAEYFETFISALLKEPHKRLSELPLLGEQERLQLILWNETLSVYPKNKSIHQLFEETVAKVPDAIAVVYEEQQISYKALNQRSNQLAHYLQSLGVATENRVGIILPKGVDLIVGLLAILKSGGVYVPLDKDYPQERLSYMIEDSQVKLLLSLNGVALPSYKGKVVYLDEEDLYVNQPNSNLCLSLGSENLAYMIYTSGSTGRPKGVMVQHKNLTNILIAIQKELNISANDKLLNITTPVFDIAALEFFSPLISGATLVLPSKETMENNKFREKIDNYQITMVQATPSFWQTTLNQYPNSDRIKFKVLCGGEALNINLINNFLEKGGNVWNLYGPTETTIWSSFKHYNKEQSISTVSIGMPLSNTQVYILDRNLNPVSIGVSGEIYIGGDGLARGYFNRPGLTAERFIPNPFVSHSEVLKKINLRLYQTGDLARFLPDGNIEFLGRIDDQVKIRGFRIELGEIGAILQNHSDVVQAVVLARKDEASGQDIKLVAYIALSKLRVAALKVESELISSAGDPFAVLNTERLTSLSEDLRNLLSRFLPDYMIPAFFVYLDRIPLTINGKIDRKNLPAPDLSLRLVTEAFVIPQTPIEEEICSIWKDVLKIEKIGIYDNFFKLGGHSLLATQVISRIRKSYNIDIPLRTLFEQPTIELLSLVVDTLRNENIQSSFSSLLPKERKGPIPLSFAQARLWFLDQFLPGMALYNIPIAIRLKGFLDIPALEKAFNAVVERHESLRTIFPSTKGEAYQEIRPRLVINLNKSIIDLNLTKEKRDFLALQNFTEQEAMTPFNLSIDPLIRVKLIIVEKNEYILLITMHHIVSDGWSISILFKELSTFYNAYTNLKEPLLPALPIQYADFALWQIQWLQGSVLEQQISYWKQQLLDIPDVLELPIDNPRPKELTYKGALYRYTLSKQIKDKLKNLSQEYQTSLFMTLLAVFQILLYRYTGQKDIVVGTPIANRHYKEVEGLIGSFVNTLALRTKFRRNETFIDVLSRVKETTLQGYQHQDVPFEQLVDHLNIPRVLNRNPVFQVMFTLQNTNFEEPLTLEEIQVLPFYSSYPIAKFDLSLNIYEGKEQLEISIEYATDLFKAETVKRMANHFNELIEGILKNPTQEIHTLPLLSQIEQQQILIDWNDTKAEYSEAKTIHQLFEEQVKRNPDNIAVVFGELKLTYLQLNKKANQLAYHLRDLSVSPDILVAISIERSLEMIIGLLAILKAGGAYVPLDPTYPLDRLIFMLEDTQASVLITQASLQNKFKGYLGTILNIQLQKDKNELLIEKCSFNAGNSQIQRWLSRSSKSFTNLETLSGPRNIAYVIYTSGSTGNPKGVMIENRSFLNHMLWMQEEYQFSDKDTILQRTASSFDASVWELFIPLISGAKIVLASLDSSKDIKVLGDIIHGYKVTTLQLVPSLLRLFLQFLAPEELSTSLKKLFVGGEPLLLKDAHLLFSKLSNIKLTNLYGPTEATIDTTAFNCNSIEELKDLSTIPIGSPISNMQVYLLDPQINPVPIGISGEIYIGGAGLARGYLNKPGLTAERFIPNPFEVGSRLYKTGDLGRYLPDGNIEFLERIDHQVKLRGFRIELGEIERTLECSNVVQQAVVLCRENVPGQKRLVAYIVAKNKKDTKFLGTLQNFCQSRLPDYMQPSQWVVLESLPLTVNGKIDRKKLPIPEGREGLEDYQAPEGLIEERLAQVWSDLLGLDKIGRNDNFFQVGGDSIVSIQLVSRARQQGMLFSVKQVFETPTIAGLALHTKTENTNFVSQELAQGIVPLSPIQTWFFQQNPQNPHHFNQVMWIRSEEPINLNRLQNALVAVYQHHDAFRLRFRKMTDDWEQYYAAEVPLPWKEWQTSTKDNLDNICTELQSSLNIEQGPLSQIIWFTEKGQLLWIIHHLIVDGVSWRILLEDLNIAYAGKTLGAKSHSYQDWTQSLYRYVPKDEVEYYRSQLQTIPRIPKDYAYSGSIALRDVQELNISFSEHTTKQFLQRAHQSFGTQPDDLLLLALVQAVGDCFGKYQLCVDLEGHGREDLGENLDLTRTLGWFTSMHPVVLSLVDPFDLEQSIKHIKEHLRQIPQKGVSFGILTQVQKTCAVVQADVVFNYLGQWSNSKRKEQTFFFVEGETGNSAGLDNPPSHSLAINGGVTQEQLGFQWSYSTRHYNRETIDRLSKAFKERLERLVEYCSEEKHYGFSPSDFPYINLQGKQLDNLLKKIGGSNNE